jgi:hypothetical protein
LHRHKPRKPGKGGNILPGGGAILPDLLELWKWLHCNMVEILAFPTAWRGPRSPGIGQGHLAGSALTRGEWRTPAGGTYFNARTIDFSLADFRAADAEFPSSAIPLWRDKIF